MPDPSIESTPEGGPSAEPATPEAATADADAGAADAGAAPDGTGDTLHRNFRAALDRKRTHQHRGEEHRDSHGAGPANNRKTTRQFRRKSG